MAEVRFKGTLISWEEARGFGFISPDADPDDRVFLHVKDLALSRKPKEDDRVEFRLEKQADGRYRAKDAVFVGAQTRLDLSSPLWFVSAFCFACSVALAAKLDFLWLVGLYPLASALTAILYVRDKSAAQSSTQRVSELTLHLFELIGGWPGGLLSQRMLRHKTVKAAYQRDFIVIVWLHGFAGLVVLGYVLLAKGR